MSSPSVGKLQPRHLANLSEILRQANTRYERIAATIRASFKPTCHARRRAHNLGLSINTKRAAACPQSQVSVIPLPIVVQSTSPIEPRNRQTPHSPVVGTVLPPRLRIRKKGALRHSYTHMDVNMDHSSPEEISHDNGDDMDFRCSGQGHSASLSSSDDSSSGPITPPDASPLMIRIKRKSHRMEQDGEHDVFEKRRKLTVRSLLSHARKNSLASCT